MIKIHNKSASHLSCTYCKNTLCIRNDADSTAQGAHGCDHRPLVGLWAVAFACLKALLSVETATNVNLGRREKKKKKVVFF